MIKNPIYFNMIDSHGKKRLIPPHAKGWIPRHQLSATKYIKVNLNLVTTGLTGENRFKFQKDKA